MINDTCTPTVSIITPVYNGKAYIDKCFTCIQNQSYQNIEWVVINDGSEDDSLSKLQKIASDYSNLTIIDQKNAGAAEARRVGAQRARGDYIAYLDIDDAISEDAIQLAMAKFNEEVDLVLFKQIKVGGDEPIHFNMFTDKWPQKGIDVFKSCIDGWGAHSFGVYRKEVFSNAYVDLDKFESLSKTYKDELLSRIIFAEAKMVEHCEGTYFYDLNDDSVSKKFNAEYFKIAHNAFALEELLKSQSKDISIERMYSRLYFDLLGRYVKWRKELTNKDEWRTTLSNLAKHISIKQDINNCIKKSQYIKIVPRLLCLTFFKVQFLMRVL